MRSSAFSSRSRYLAIGYLPSEVLLAFEPMYELTLGSKRRAKEARQFVVGFLKRRRIKSWKEGEEVRASIPLTQPTNYLISYPRLMPRSMHFASSGCIH